MDIVYRTCWEKEFQGADTPFTVVVDRVYDRGMAWEFDPMSDCNCLKTVEDESCKRITIIPDDNRSANYFGDFESMTRTLPTDLARRFCLTLLRDGNRSCWFSKDMLDYAYLHDVLIG